MSIAFRTVGRSGLVVSELGLGTAAFGSRNRIPGGQPDADAIVRTALDLGVTLFDTAESYGDERGVSESMLGLALAGRRHEAIISTSSAPGATPSRPFASVRLRTRSSIRAAPTVAPESHAHSESWRQRRSAELSRSLLLCAIL